MRLRMPVEQQDRRTLPGLRTMDLDSLAGAKIESVESAEKVALRHG
jgi:hypothetical protein